MKLKCSHCSKRFKYESERKRHEDSHSPNFQCAVCSKKFSFLSALRRHEKQHDRKNYVYCTCGKKFRDEILLKRHINYAHKGTFNCEKCSASFNSDTALQTHMKTHKPESERKFKCTFDGCGKSFNFHHHLKHHILTHTNAKQHYCDVCKKGFIQLHHLKAHLNTHNPGSWLYCIEPNCKKKFTTEYARKRHLLTHKVNAEAENTSPLDTISNESPARNSMIGVVDSDLKNSELLKDIACVASANTITEPQKRTKSIEEPPIKFEEQASESYVKNLIDCKTAVGGCLMKAESDNNNCLCAQMSENTETPYDLSPIVDKVKSTNNNVFNCNPSTANCEDCECASVCSLSNTKPPGMNFYDPGENVKPNIEIGINGAIKIKETFDIELKNDVYSPAITSHNDIESFPYNSCKAVLGNCIVSGNATIGEGCLCMKMKIEEQQVTPEEIEEIVPHPSDPKLYSTVINI
ncbi:metal regulatory transcription factor 1 isoform X2 [Manduca sexta]|uniref:C2H2-type domain-containing protein n=3 Tax=Manduca sexta TaxID=7130 RepID=A0A921YZM8_MANSE|nr:metal regulatory transcription factor 1 isoform X2 [Manduca sexta]XP_037300191.1 metal regulatory transcription factor 1 isoform X2 [Manduca sexta]XP_037300192.1 metal regulatory transcription factor 1 isoform X2 [Manduca sexta]KAG6447999.1 hypothetical protein O3G_MSEX005251 [Manduca sexta]KAG6448000.1 hypothetical protein O3G_MSEX005251 [Manduca sexta]